MRFFLPVVFAIMIALPTTPASAEPLTDFSPAERETFSWQIVNDGVMGGLSKGDVEFSEAGTLRFSGNLSLANNGGFSTVRSGKIDLDLSRAEGLLLRVRGDGRTYQARLESTARYRAWPVSFSGEFATVEGEWREVKIPFSSFRGGFRGRDLPDRELDPSEIRRIGILLADKREGPFSVEIDWIHTYGSGGGGITGASESSLPKNLIDTAEADGRFETLRAALDAAGLTTFFQWDNPLTVFAPTDEAFARLPEGRLDELLRPENRQRLAAILSHHVVPGAHPLKDLRESGRIKPIKGIAHVVTVSGDQTRIGQAGIIEADIPCSDGIIHVIDSVLIPANLDQLVSKR